MLELNGGRMPVYPWLHFNFTLAGARDQPALRPYRGVQIEPLPSFSFVVNVFLLHTPSGPAHRHTRLGIPPSLDPIPFFGDRPKVTRKWLNDHQLAHGHNPVAISNSNAGSKLRYTAEKLCETSDWTPHDPISATLGERVGQVGLSLSRISAFADVSFSALLACEEKIVQPICRRPLWCQVSHQVPCCVSASCPSYYPINKASLASFPVRRDI
jgi:hypothetical protein